MRHESSCYLCASVYQSENKGMGLRVLLNTELMFVFTRGHPALPVLWVFGGWAANSHYDRIAAGLAVIHSSAGQAGS